MKRPLLIAAFMLGGAASAQAADFPVKAAPASIARPIYDWTGIYLGINAGYGRNSNCWDMNGALVFGFNPAIPEGCNDASGAIVGGQIGYRHQFGSLVLGIEAQGDWADLSGNNASGAPAGIAASFGKTIPANIAVALVNSTKTDAIGMFTGQVGWSFGSVLWYVKGGAAATNNHYDGALSLSATRGEGPAFTLGAADHADEVKFGGVVGTGVDIMFAPNWTVGVEYSHLFMGSQTVGFALTGLNVNGNVPTGHLGAPGMPTRNDTISSDIDMATVRLNYSFRPQ